MNFPSQIFLNNTSHGYRAVILKKSICGSFPSRWLWLLNAIMKRCTKKCALQLYNTFSTSYYMIVNVRCKWVNLKNGKTSNQFDILQITCYIFTSLLQAPPRIFYFKSMCMQWSTLHWMKMKKCKYILSLTKTYQLQQ